MDSEIALASFHAFSLRLYAAIRVRVAWNERFPLKVTPLPALGLSLLMGVVVGQYIDVAITEPIFWGTIVASISYDFYMMYRGE